MEHERDYANLQGQKRTLYAALKSVPAHKVCTLVSRARYSHSSTYLGIE